MDALEAHACKCNGAQYPRTAYLRDLAAIKAPYTAAVQAALDEDTAMGIAQPIVAVVAPAPVEPTLIHTSKGLVVDTRLADAQTAYRAACAAAKATLEDARHQWQAACRHLEQVKRDAKAMNRAAYLALKAATK